MIEILLYAGALVGLVALMCFAARAIVNHFDK